VKKGIWLLYLDVDDLLIWVSEGKHVRYVMHLRFPESSALPRPRANVTADEDE